MATAIDHEDDKKLICPICFEQFKSPRVLPCLHTFCEECLDAQLKCNYVCPICKAALPRTTDEDKSLIDAFPLSNIVIYLIKSFDDTVSNDKDCQPCKAENDTNLAEVWCVDCQEQFCSSCKRSHKGMRITKDHKIVPIDEKQQNLETRMQISNIQDCVRHRGHRLETYCSEHSELCCSMCRALKHRACKNIRDIAEIADEQNRRSTYSKSLEEVKTMQIEVNKFAEEKIDNLKVIGLEKDKGIHEVDIAVDKAIDKLNQTRKQFKHEIKSLHSRRESSLQQQIRIVQAFLKNIANLKLVIESIGKNISVPEKFIMYESFRSQVRLHYQQLINESQFDAEETHFVSELNSFILNLDESLSTLCTVELYTRKSPILSNFLTKIDDVMKKLNLQFKMNTKLCAAQVETIDLMTSPVSYVKSVTRQDLGRQAYFSGGTFLSDGCLVMVNRNSNRLVIFGNDYNLEREHQLSGCPSDVAAGTTDNQVYVAMNDQNIYKYELGARLTLLCKIKIPEDAWGIAVHDDEFMVVATKQSVLVVTQGEIVPVVQQLQTYSFAYVAVSRSKKTFYHRDEVSVVCRSFDGIEMFPYKPGRFPPRGICLDMHDNIYVCSQEFPKIHQVSSDGRRSRNLIDRLERIVAPLSIIFNSKKNELVVTSNAEDTVFEVYKLG